MAIAGDGKLLIIMTLIEYCALHSPRRSKFESQKGGSERQHIIHYKLSIDHKHLEERVCEWCKVYGSIRGNVTTCFIFGCEATGNEVRRIRRQPSTHSAVPAPSPLQKTIQAWKQFLIYFGWALHFFLKLWHNSQQRGAARSSEPPNNVIWKFTSTEPECGKSIFGYCLPMAMANTFRFTNQQCVLECMFRLLRYFELRTS